MSQSLRAGIIGAGWPGAAHARGYAEAGGFKVVAVADQIPDRRAQLMQQRGDLREFSDALGLVKDKDIDVVSICLPNHLHAPIAIAALKAGKHVCCEKPPTLNAREAQKIADAATKSKKTIIYSFQRRFGGPELATKAALDKGYAGAIHHVRASFMRTRGIPAGTGWYVDPTKSGGGAMIDLGIHMLDLAWHLMGEPKPQTVFASSHRRFNETVDDFSFATIRFEGGRTLEVAASWAINQPPQQQGMLCRLSGEKAAIDVYTPGGAVIYRNFDKKGAATPTALKPPKVTGHAAMMRQFKQVILGEKQSKLVAADQGVQLMQMIDAIHKSAASGNSGAVKA